MISSCGPVVVGIDGSKTAIRAALWAIDEATSRNVALRLVYVAPVDGSPVDPMGSQLELVYGEMALREACAAIEATGKPAKIDSSVRWGEVDAALADESQAAALICVGSVGISRVSAVLGSTAVALAKHAHCPVAIIRSDTALPAEGGWIAVPVEVESGNNVVIHQAMEEARLREAPVLALHVTCCRPGDVPFERFERRLGHWAQRYPDVHVEADTAAAGAEHYLATHSVNVQLAVVGSRHASHVARLVGPRGHKGLGRAGCSVLFVRE